MHAALVLFRRRAPSPCMHVVVRVATPTYLLMEQDAAGELGSSVTSAPNTLYTGDTHAGPSSSLGSCEFELQVFPRAAGSIATPDRRPHDDRDSSNLPTENPFPPVKKAMSRVPLLVRSSPAQGTGKPGNALVDSFWSHLQPSM